MADRDFRWDIVFWGTVGLVCAAIALRQLPADRFLQANVDVRHHMLPINLVAAESIRGNEWPQWNPTIFCGTPLIISAGNTYYYPPLLLLSRLPPAALLRAINGLTLLHLVAAAAAARACMGWFIASRFWAVYAALAYWLSFTLMLELLQSPVGNGYLAHALLPAWLYLACSSSRRTLPANLLLQGTIGSYLLLGGMTQYVLYALGIVLLVGVLDAAARQRTWRAVLWRGTTILAALAIALAVAGIRLVPLAVTMLRVDQGVSQSLRDAVAENVSSPAYVLRLFAPFFFGWSEDVNIGRMWADRFGIFAGVLTAALALAGLTAGPWRRRWLPWVVTAALLLAISLDTPVAALGHLLSGGLSVPFRRLTLFAILPLSVLAGLAGMRLETAGPGPALRRRVSGILVAAAVLLAVVWAGFAPGDRALVWSATRLSAGWLLAAAWVWYLAAYRFRAAGLLRPLLAGFLVLELAATASLLVAHTTESGTVFAPLPIARGEELPAVLPQDGRIQANHPAWWGNAHVFAGRSSSGGYDNISPVTIADLYSGGIPLAREPRRFAEPRSLRTRQLTATRSWYAGERDGWQAVPGVLPRARVVFAGDVVGSRLEAVRTALAETFPFRERVVLETETELPVPARSGADERATAVISDETPNTVTVRVTTTGTGMLVLADTCYDGWVATVDDHRTTIHRVNGAFRGVVVAAGEHTVRFAYRQPGLATGAAVSAVGLGALFVVFGLALGRRFRQSSASAGQAETR